jgi:hypothetical protein
MSLMRISFPTRLLVLFAAAMAGGTPAAASPLPRLAVSLAPGLAPSAAVRIVDDCKLDDAVLVMPAVEASVGSRETVPAASDLPAGRFFLHLKLTVGEVPGAGREREALVEHELDAIVAALGVDRPPIAGVVVEPVGTGAPEDVLQFTLAMLMVRLKAVNPKLDVALALPEGMVDRSFDAAARLMAYADSLVVPAAALPGFDASKLQAVAAGKPIVVHAPPAPGGAADSAARAWLDLLMTPGAALAATSWVEAGDLPALRALCDAARRLARSLASGFEMTAPERAPLAVMADGRPVAPAVAFVGSQSADIAFLLKTGATPASPRQLSLSADAAVTKTARVECLDALSGLNLGASAAGASSPGCRVDADYVLLRASVPGGSDRLFEAVRVTGRSSLRVEEIIARWQAAREMQRLLLDDYSVPCFLGIHFEAANLAISFDVALELREFVDRSGDQDWVQTAFRVNGVKLRKGQEFPLPQIEPDKVVTRPLELRIDEKYAYQLLGTETVDGRVCFVVSIKPAQPGESLYSGKVWIDGLDFRQVRLRLEQRDGKNNVAAHVETQEFEIVKDAKGRPFNLVRSIYAEDSLNLAGRSVTVEKRYLFGEYSINAPDFRDRLKAARASNDPMFRDTGDGLRALRKNAAGERVVEPLGAKRVRALVGGVLYDGSHGFPIPLAGLSWIDFDWRKTGMQLSAFFAGPIFAGNLSRQVNKNFRWGVDLSLIALPFTYYEYSGNEEITARRVRNFEQSVGGLVNWQATAGLDFSLQADLLYDLYRATDVTSPDYRLPASGFTLDAYGEAKYVRKSFTALATIRHGRRLGWRPFGYPDDAAVTFPDYTRYSFEFSQHVFVGKLTRGGVSVGYYGGSHLDRFSQYSPSFLARPTMHGIPSGVDSFDQVTTLSGYYGFNVADLAKLEGYYTHAWTTNRLEGPDVRQFDGLDASIGIAGPLGTFLQGSVSFAIRGNLERYASRWGTYLLFLKPLKK